MEEAHSTYDGLVHATLDRISQDPSRHPLSAEALDRACRELLALAPGQQALKARNGSLYGRPEVVWRLIHRAEALRHGDPHAMLQVARAAVRVADAVPDDAACRAVQTDARVEAWACLANAHRVNGHLSEAERIWRRIPPLARDGSGDPLLRGKTLRLEGTLRTWQGRYDEAIRLLHEAHHFFIAAGDMVRAGRTLISLAIAYRESGQVEQAIETVYHGGRMVSVGAELDLRLAAAHNFVHYLYDAGKSEQAVRLVERLNELYDDQEAPLLVLRLRWLHGRIYASLGWHEEALRHLEGVRRELVERRLSLLAALITLDVAALYSEQGRSLEVERLAAQMVSVFEAKDLPHYVARAGRYFLEAVARRTATAEMIRSLAQEIRERRRPQE